MKKPLIAQICAGIAWFSVLSGVLFIVVGALNFYHGSSDGITLAGIGGAFLFSAVPSFALEKIITLLAEIAANGKRSKHEHVATSPVC
jgi:hypothetical protein